MGSIARVRRKHPGRGAEGSSGGVGVGAGDELVVEAERGKVMIKARPRSYARYMLGLHKDVWKGVKVEEYVKSWSSSNSRPVSKSSKRSV